MKTFKNDNGNYETNLNGVKVEIMKTEGGTVGTRKGIVQLIVWKANLTWTSSNGEHQVSSMDYISRKNNARSKKQCLLDVQETYEYLNNQKEFYGLPTV